MTHEQQEALTLDPLDSGSAEKAARVWAESAQWSAFETALYPNARPTDEESATIRRVIAERCRPGVTAEALRAFVVQRLARLSDADGFALAAARRSGAVPHGSDSPKDGSRRGEGAAEDVTFVFVSDAPGDPSGSSRAWRAEMTLPADAGVDDLLSITLFDGRGEAADGGLFRVAGAALPVVRGRAEIPYGLFLTGIRDIRVERVTAQGVRQPGTLALF